MLLRPQYTNATLTGYRLTPVELDTTTSTIHDDYITVANPTHIDISIADWTNAALTSADIVGTFTITNAGNTGNTGNTGGYNGNANQTTVTEGDDRVQINVATSSTNSISGMINAAGGMDSLHLDGTNFFSDSAEDLDVSSDDAQITSQMLTNFGSGDFGVGNNFAKIDLGDTLAGTVHVWTQTPEYYQGNEPFDAVLGILNNDTGMLVASNDDGDPTTGYSSQAM